MSRPLGDIRPPGVYVSNVDAPARGFSLADIRDVGFLGRAVEGFFMNGGQTCYVVRVAHRARNGAEAGPDHANAAERVAKDGWEKPSVRVRARSEGRWGNN